MKISIELFSPLIKLILLEKGIFKISLLTSLLSHFLLIKSWLNEKLKKIIEIKKKAIIFEFFLPLYLMLRAGLTSSVLFELVFQLLDIFHKSYFQF